MDTELIESKSIVGKFEAFCVGYRYVNSCIAQHEVSRTEALVPYSTRSGFQEH